jgi:D-alanyl-D-alanine endopeptidase (penicillin-binding protein 7)
MVFIGLLASSSIFAKDITAQSWLITDYKGTIIDGENTNEVRSIASISKLVTVMTVLDAHQNLSEKVNQFTRGELIQLALIKSDNHSADVLCNNYPGGRESCVSAMNTKVQNLGLTHTHFIEPTGLSVFNVSTAEELVDIVLEASKYSEITAASQTSDSRVKNKKRWYVFHNTNPLVKHYSMVVSKTGYIRAAGGCIVMMLDKAEGRRILILLGSKNTHTRIPEAKLLADRY